MKVIDPKVVLPYARIDPWAVMIEPLNASITQIAMSATGCSNNFTKLAK